MYTNWIIAIFVLIITIIIVIGLFYEEDKKKDCGVCGACGTKDKCGNDCTGCPDGENCINGQCILQECGWSALGNNMGSCQSGQYCVDGSCLNNVFNPCGNQGCQGKCGFPKTDTCGNPCVSCPLSTQKCVDGSCLNSF